MKEIPTFKIPTGKEREKREKEIAKMLNKEVDLVAEEKKPKLMQEDMISEEREKRKKEIAEMLKEEVNPVVEEEIEENSIAARLRAHEEYQKREKLLIIRSEEKRELSSEEKRIKLEKLREYLEVLKNNKAHFIVADIKAEKALVRDVIKELEKELKEES